MSILDKLARTFNFRVTNQASFLLPSPLGFIPVVTDIDCTGDAAAVLTLSFGTTRSVLARDPTGANNQFTVRSLRGGLSGDGLSLEIVENGNNTALSVVTTVNAVPATGGYDVDILVNLETDGAGNGISTAAEVIDAINNDATANLYIEAYPTTTAAATAGVIDEDLAATALASGANATAWVMEFEAAFSIAKTFAPGVLMADYAGSDVHIAISAGVDRELNVGGFYIPGALQSRPHGIDRSEPGMVAAV